MSCTANYYNEGQCMEQHGTACVKSKCKAWKAWKGKPKRNPYITLPRAELDKINGDWTPLSTTIDELISMSTKDIKDQKSLIELIKAALEKNISITFCMSKTDPLVSIIQGSIDGTFLGFPINYTSELIVKRMREIIERLSIYERQ